MAPQTLETLPENWLETAASYGATKWLQQFIRFYLSELQAGRLSPDAFANELEEEFASRNLNTAKQQKNYRSNVVMALKQLDPQHPAIELVALSSEQYRILNDEQRGRLADRETRFIHYEVVDTLVEMATTLLSSEEWSDIGAGLVVLVGRRISEIIFANFALQSPWSLAFSQMAKKAEEGDITIEVPTLAPAPTVLAAIQRLQTYLGADLDAEHLSPRKARRMANSRYSGAIAHKCDDYFSALVPNRSDKDNLYTHIFRAVYATIAAHWYCPPSVPEHQFKAEIQGHFSLTPDGQKLPNYSARSNYDDYAIGDGQGNRDGRLGIKLGQVEGLQVIEAFRPADNPAPEAIAGSTESHEPVIEVLDITQLPHWIDWAASHATTDWLQQFIRRWLPQLAHDILSPDASADALSEELEFRGLPSFQQQQSYREQVVAAIREVFLDHPAIPLITQPESLAEMAHDKPPPPSHEMSTTKQPTTSLNLYTEDIDLMSELMAKRGVSGTPAEMFRALLETFISEMNKRQMEALDGVGQTLNWFTQEIDTLRRQYRDLEREHQRSSLLPITSSDGAEEVAALKERNAQLEEKLDEITASKAQLEKELHDTQNRLNGIQQLLGGNSPIPTTDPPQTHSVTPDSTADDDSTKQRDRSESVANIADIIDAIIKWNTAQERSELRLRISFPIVKSLGILVGAGYQSAIKEVMDKKETEIDDIHQRYTIGSRHNRSVPNKDEVLRTIARDYLGFPNWQEAEYTT